MFVGGLGGIWKDVYFFGILFLGSVCGISGEKWIYWRVLKYDLKNMLKKRDLYGFEVDEEECEYF